MKSATQPTKNLANFDLLPDTAFVRLPVVMAVLGVSRSTVLRAIDRNEIPKPIKITQRTNGFNVGLLRKHLASRFA